MTGAKPPLNRPTSVLLLGCISDYANDTVYDVTLMTESRPISYPVPCSLRLCHSYLPLATRLLLEKLRQFIPGTSRPRSI